MKIKDTKDNTYIGNRTTGYDILKLISCYFIILIHIAGDVYYASWETIEWKGALFQQSVTRFAVPCFILISGALNIRTFQTNLNGIISIGSIASKLFNIIIPLFFWQIMHLIWSLFIDKVPLEEIIYDLKKMPFEHIRGHFWYGYLMIWFYLFLPLLSLIIAKASNIFIVYFCIVLLFLPSFLDFIIIILQINARSPLYIAYGQMGCSEIGLFLLGALCQKMKDRLNNGYAAIISTVGIVLGVLLEYCSSYYISNRTGSPSVMMFDYLRFPSLVYGTSVFVLTIYLEKYFIHIPGRLKRYLQNLSKLTKGVYFGHLIISWSILLIMSKVGVVFDRSVGEMYVICFLILCVSLFTIYCLSRIPFVRRLV